MRADAALHLLLHDERCALTRSKLRGIQRRLGYDAYEYGIHSSYFAKVNILPKQRFVRVIGIMAEQHTSGTKQAGQFGTVKSNLIGVVQDVGKNESIGPPLDEPEISYDDLDHVGKTTFREIALQFAQDSARLLQHRFNCLLVGN